MPPKSLLAILFVAAACAARPTPIADRADDRRLLSDVRTIVAELGPGVRAAVWLGPAGGQPTLAWNVESPLPCASSIKAAYLVEWFAAHQDALDQPPAGVADLLADDRHPAVAHFAAPQRQAAQQALGAASVRRIGEAMITGAGVDNATYNLAANVVTAHFGGPTWLEAKLHARDPAWRGLCVRRYMLADRVAHGDNEATAHALAAVHAALARRSVRGLSPATVDAVRAVLAQSPDPAGRAVFRKGGSLDSAPVTRVEAGFCEGPRGATVHVVMLAQDGVDASARAAAGQRLGDAARRITDRLLAAP